MDSHGKNLTHLKTDLQNVSKINRKRETKKRKGEGGGEERRG